MTTVRGVLWNAACIVVGMRAGYITFVVRRGIACVSRVEADRTLLIAAHAFPKAAKFPAVARPANGRVCLIHRLGGISGVRVLAGQALRAVGPGCRQGLVLVSHLAQALEAKRASRHGVFGQRALAADLVDAALRVCLVVRRL